mgnify:FL=1
MLKIHQLFFRTYISIFFAILITLSLLIYFWTKNLYLDQIEKNLIQNIDTLSIVLKDKQDIHNITNIVEELHSKLNLRITIIAEDGEVIAESDKDISKIKNHANRVEIIQARNVGLGKDTRLSDTVKKDLIYVAKKTIIENKIYFIRMADYTDKINNQFTKLSLEIFSFITFFLIIVFIATYFISLRIKKETDTILYFLTQLSNKKQSFTLNSDYTYEFNKIESCLISFAL